MNKLEHFEVCVRACYVFEVPSLLPSLSSLSLSSQRCLYTHLYRLLFFLVVAQGACSIVHQSCACKNVTPLCLHTIPDLLMFSVNLVARAFILFRPANTAKKCKEHINTNGSCLDKRSCFCTRVGLLRFSLQHPRKFK